MGFLLFFIVTVPCIWFIIQSVREYPNTDTTLKFLMFGEPLPRSNFLTTLLASNSGLSGAIYLCAVYGWIAGAAVGIWASLFFLLTMFASDFVIKTINAQHPNFLQNRGTLHEYLGSVFGPKTRLAAAIASILAYVGLVACELVLAREVLEALLSASGMPTDLAMYFQYGLATLVIVYTFAAGFRAVIKTERTQIGIMVLMLFASVIIACSCISESGLAFVYERHAEVFGTGWGTLLFFPKSQPTVLDHMFFLVFLNIVFWAFWWPVAMDQWHRAAATQTAEVARDRVTGTAGKIARVYLAFLSIVFCCLGVTVASGACSASGDSFGGRRLFGGRGAVWCDHVRLGREARTMASARLLRAA